MECDVTLPGGGHGSDAHSAAGQQERRKVAAPAASRARRRLARRPGAVQRVEKTRLARVCGQHKCRPHVSAITSCLFFFQSVAHHVPT